MPEHLPTPPPGSVPARDAFSALPLERPDHPAWPAVAVQARRRRPARLRRPLWFAAAAGVLLMLGIVARVSDPAGPPPAPEASTAPLAGTQAQAEIDALIARSTQLEAQVRDVDPSLRSAGAVLAAQWIAADIGAIDARLAHASGDEALELWRGRVLLLDELAGLRRSEAWLAAGGDPDSAYPILD